MHKRLWIALLTALVSCAPDAGQKADNATIKGLQAVNGQKTAVTEDNTVNATELGSDDEKSVDEEENSQKLEDQTTDYQPVESGQKPPKSPVKGPSIYFEAPIHDFGRVKDGEWVFHTFTYTNIGDEPLLITDAKAACGCTSPKYSEEAVLPGESGTVEVVFDSKSRPGKQDKYITLFTNGNPARTIIRMKGAVEANE